jgi:eukaryotic-like serine/threonine-protein kinase
VTVKHKKLLIIPVVLLLLILVVSGCTRSTPSRGWAGCAVHDGTLFVASMSGRIIAIDTASGTILEPSPQLLVQTSGGFSCSCGKSISPVVIFASPVVEGTIVYISGMDGRVYAYSFVDNKLKDTSEWMYPRQGSMTGSVVGGMVLSEGKLYFATSDGAVYALKADGLYEEWKVELGDKIWSAPILDGDTLYVGSLDKKVYALNTSDGSTKWKLELDGGISAAPVVYDNKVFIGDYNRHFYALNAANGEIVWQFPSDDKNADSPKNWFWATPVIVNNVVYAPSLDGNVYALNAGTGNLIKKFVLGDSISSSPVVIGDSVIVATTDLYKKKSKLFLINTTDNSQQELESYDEGINAALFAANGFVYIHTTKDNLYGINPETKAEQTFSLSTVN